MKRHVSSKARGQYIPVMNEGCMGYRRLWRRLPPLLLLACGLAAAGGSAPRDKSITELPGRLAAVDSLLRAGDPAAALHQVDLLDATWGQDPLYGGQIADRRGWALLAQGRPAEALPLLEQTVGRRPYDAGAHRNLALALAQLGRRGRALAEYTQAVELDPANGIHRLEHAQFLTEFGQWGAAAAEFQAAAERCGSCPAAERGLGAALLQLGRPDEAVLPLSRAQAAEPDSVGRRLLVAALHGAARDSALLALLAAEDRQRWDRRDHLALVEAEGRRGGEPVESLAYANSLAAGSPPPCVADDALFWGRVALNLLKAGRWQAGLGAADRAVALEPDSAVYRNNRVVLLLRLGRDEEAAREWETVLRLDPGLKERPGP